MENDKIKRGRGRPKVLTNEQRRHNKTAYKLGKEWYCQICMDGIDYSLAGKTLHCRTNKHRRNKDAKIIMRRIIEITHK